MSSLIVVVKTKIVEFGIIITGRLCDKQKRLVLGVIVIEVPELLLGLPPLNDTTKTSDGEEDLDVPVPTVPTRIVFPSFANILNTLDQRFAYFWLSSKLRNRHINDIRGNTYETVESGHCWIDWIIDEDA